MKESRDIHELMMEYLYGELDADQAEAFKARLAERPDLAAELAGLERTRQALRELPEIDPPQGVTARLLHEAAKQAEARQAKEQGGFFGWVAGLFQPLVAHPAWAAAAGLVLVLGAAALLAGRGLVSEKVEMAPTAHEAAAPPPTPVDTPAVTAPPAGGARPDLANADEASEKQAEQAPAAEGARKGRAATVPEEKELKQKAVGGKRELEEDADDNFAAPSNAGVPAPGGVTGGLADRKEDKSVAAEPEATTAPEPAPAKPADLERRYEPPKTPAMKAPSVEKPVEKSKDYGSGPTQAAPKLGYQQPAPPPPPASAPTSTRGQDGRAAAGDSAPSDALSEETAKREGSQQQAQRKKSDVAPVQALHQQARQRVSSGRCGDAMTITREIARRDPSYYKRAVLGDATASCEEAERRRSKNAKPAPRPSRDQLDAPAETQQKAN